MNELRVGIVGTDNSHAAAFANILNRARLGEEVFEPLPARVTVLCADDDEARGRETAQACDIAEVVTEPKALIGKVDAAIVVHRHGDKHAPAAVPLLESGMPVFVDKPLACRIEDAEAILAAARRGKTAAWSCSAVRFADDFLAFVEGLPETCGEARYALFSTPADRDSPYGGIRFYAIHGVEMALEACGYDVRDVAVSDYGDRIVAHLTYGSGLVADVQLVRNAAGAFYALVHGASGVRFLKVSPSRSFYYDTLLRFLELAESRQPLLSDEELLAPVRILDRIAEQVQ